jgi:succinate dehydrogenase / fumarate reductase membrane anchor subunit
MKERREGFWHWFLQRVSALYLVFGMALHFLLTHVFMDRPIELDAVQARLISKWWIWFDITLLAAVVYHAAVGVFIVYKDYNPRPGNRKLAGWLILLAGVATMLAGLCILVPLAGRGS